MESPASIFMRMMRMAEKDSSRTRRPSQWSTFIRKLAFWL